MCLFPGQPRSKSGLEKLNSHWPCPGPPGFYEVLSPCPAVHNALTFMLPSISHEHQLRNNTIRSSQFHLLLLILPTFYLGSTSCFFFFSDRSILLLRSLWSHSRLLFKHIPDNIPPLFSQNNFAEMNSDFQQWQKHDKILAIMYQLSLALFYLCLNFKTWRDAIRSEGTKVYESMQWRRNP